VQIRLIRVHPWGIGLNQTDDVMTDPSQRFSLAVDGDKPEVPPVPPEASDPKVPLEDRVVAVLKTVYDPELPLDIYSLGLIYGLDVSPEGNVQVRRTLTAPACPVAGSLPGEIESKIKAIPGVTAAKVELVWDPPWDKSRLSEEAALQLGLF
jgi:FeS assembly SUF system protein